MQTMKRLLLTAILLISTAVTAKPWMPWDNNSYGNNDGFMDSFMPWSSNNDEGWGAGKGFSNWGPFDSGSNFGPFDSASNWGPFSGENNWGPFDGGSDWGPFSGENNWGPFSNVNDMVNDSDWGFYYNNKNKISNKGYARADGKYAGELQSRGSGYADGYTKGNADAYYKGQAEGYGKARGEGRFEGYGRKGYLGYAPGNSFPVSSD